MNYLSHYIIDHKPQSPYYNTALIFPDVTKRWIKTFNHPEPSNLFSYNQHQLLLGCQSHYKSDKQFHSSPFFKEYLELVNNAMKEVAFSDVFTRKWFIAHILFELMLDRVFVKTFPQLVTDFYANLDAVADDEVLPFLHYYGLQDKEPFLQFFNHFRGVQYIYLYADNNKFLYSLSRIMMRVGITELGEDDAQKLLNIILQLEETVFSKPKVLLEELKQVFIV